MKKIIVPLFVSIIFLLQTSCSVIAAASGTPEPNLELVQAGASRAVVEKELGPPVKTESISGGQRVQYTYKLGDTPDAGRAILYLLGDIVTLFLAEYIFFPMEISNSGNAYDIEVAYDDSDNVRAVRSLSEPAKSPESK